MTSPVFVSMASAKMASRIAAARRRVAVAAPGVRIDCAEALAAAVARLGEDSVTVVTDCDEEVFRLGYGDIAALKRLREAGCTVWQSSGLRVGVLVCDDRAWVFAPTALYVQREIHSDETPNAVELHANDVARILWRISPAAREADAQAPLPPDLWQEIDRAETEIGNAELSPDRLKSTEEVLIQAPPIAFDIARQVRVFQPYIQYVKISLQGCAIERRRVEVPQSIQGLDAAAELNARLRTTFELIEKKSEVSSKKLEDDLRRIRDVFTRPLGEPWGRVMLRSARPLFDERIERFRQQLAAHRAAVKESLAKHLKDSQTQLVEHFLPLVQRSLPDVLRGQLMMSEPNEDDIRPWLEAELDEVFPKPGALVSDMRLEIVFRDVTYETLNERDFGEKLRKAYPHVNWDKPFKEYDAARARDDAAKIKNSA